jgi:prepilin-type N-terminal cleavage/methylation domain-containing protein
MAIKRVGGFTIIEVMIVMAIAALILIVVLVVTPQLRASFAKQNVNKDLSTIVAVAETAREATGKKLKDVTGSGCSECACRPDNYQAPACISNWQNALSRISAFGSDITHLQQDPWGNPYLLDENQGESGPSDCRQDRIFSAGADSLRGTSDDIVKIIPLFRNCP